MAAKTKADRYKAKMRKLPGGNYRGRDWAKDMIKWSKAVQRNIINLEKRVAALEAKAKLHTRRYQTPKWPW